MSGDRAGILTLLALPIFHIKMPQWHSRGVCPNKYLGQAERNAMRHAYHQ
jgi:hypothetical protein